MARERFVSKLAVLGEGARLFLGQVSRRSLPLDMQGC
jgi:hypothetical protein